MGFDTECLHTLSCRLRRARDDIGESVDDPETTDRPSSSSVDPVLLIQMRRPFQLFAPNVERPKISRVRNLLAKFCEFCVYKVIVSHPSKPKIRNMSPKFSKLVKGGAELKDKR